MKVSLLAQAEKARVNGSLGFLQHALSASRQVCIIWREGVACILDNKDFLVKCNWVAYFSGNFGFDYSVKVEGRENRLKPSC